MRYFDEVLATFKKHPDEETLIPVRADSGSAGHDFFSKEDVILYAGQKHTFYTDIKVHLEDDDVMYVHIRSSLGTKEDLEIANKVGVIDSTYFGNPSNDGNIIIVLKNTGVKPVHIKIRDRIAQGVVHQYIAIPNANILKDKRTGGFGSSNK